MKDKMYCAPKTFLIIMGYLMTCYLLSSCRGEDDVEAAVPFRVDISIAEYGDPQTRAVKSGWNPNEVIQVWYDSNTQQEPDLTLLYDGTNWVAADGSNAPASAAGTMKALCHADNGMILRSCQLPYTFQGGELRGSITQWTFLTRMSVTLQGTFANEAETYSLSSPVLSAPGAIAIEADDIVMTSVKGAPVRGVYNADGLGFVFADCSGFGSETEYLFELITRNGGADSTSHNAMISKLVDDPANSFVVANLDVSRFADPGANIKGRSWGHDWVQLKSGGPRFATSNLDGYFSLDDATEACALMGKGWRLLKKSDVQGSGVKWDFGNDCTKEIVTIEGAKGYKVTGQGDYLNNSIFLPFGGYYNGETKWSSTNGYYWLESESNTSPFSYFFINQSIYVTDNPKIQDFPNKAFKLFVRPVFDIN